MPTEGRAKRLGTRIQEIVSELLIFEISDPRLAGVFVSKVRVDREFSFANIFVSALEGGERQAEILDGFKHAAGFIRFQLAQRIQLRSFPQLRFHWDPSPEHAERIEELIEEIHKQKDQPDDEDKPAS
jgi:ribosome-binding factor A